MEQLKNKYEVVQNTITALELGIQRFHKYNQEDYEYEAFRESLIQRFEYTIDTFWKCLKIQKLMVDVASPRGVFRAAAEAKLINHQELNQLLDATTDRNLSSHAYDEDTAEQVTKRIPHHYLIIKSVFERIKL